MRIDSKREEGRHAGPAWMGWVALYCALVIISAYVHH